MSSHNQDFLYNGFENKKSKTVGSLFAYPLVVIFIIVLGIFVAETLFGKNSLEVLLSLKEEQKVLEQEIHLLKQQNAKLQKKYLEYKILMPNEESE